MHLHVVVMGVSGTGKSTVAQALAERLGLVLTEGDDHHPQRNVEKMRAGTPLTDADRAPWLAELAAWTARRHDRGEATVLTCSALRRRYRDVLRGAVPEPTVFVHLVGTRELLSERMARREHFMPVILLDSQFATLEHLDHDEAGDIVDTAWSLDEVVERAVRIIRDAGQP